MNQEFADLATPTLTLDPFRETKQEVVDVKEEQKLEAEEVLSEDEKKMVVQFAEQIDLTNSQMILQYGAGTQRKMADFSETALENVRTKDMGEIGNCSPVL